MAGEGSFTEWCSGWQRSCQQLWNRVQRGTTRWWRNHITPHEAKARTVTGLFIKLGFEVSVLLNAIYLVHPDIDSQNLLNLSIDISGAVVIFHALGKKSHHDYLFKLLQVSSIGVIGGYAMHSFYMLPEYHNRARGCVRFFSRNDAAVAPGVGEITNYSDQLETYMAEREAVNRAVSSRNTVEVLQELLEHNTTPEEIEAHRASRQVTLGGVQS